MAVKRGDEFPATSIGRTSGARLQQASAAHEAHPLLSPGPSSPTPSEQGHAGSTSGNGATPGSIESPRYVPYTPRQRVTPTAATTGTTVHPPSPQQHQGDATSKLQLMHLKAAAQSIGLDSGTLGWSILEKLVLDLEINEEWVEVWSAITSGKATLLLPLEPAFANEKINAEFVKDHLVLCDGPSRKGSPIVTLSGLRGTLEDETLTFRSTINPTSKLFQDLLNLSTRVTALAQLPPLPSPLPDIPPAQYPRLQVPSYSSSLPLPPRSQTSTKPPLPPRPGSRPAASAQTSTSRISLPFASLFGGGPSKTSTPVPPSPPTSLHSFDSAHDGSASVELSAFTLDRRIVRKEIAKEINKALKGELKAALAATTSLGNIPSWVAERVHGMTTEWYPFVKKPSPSPLKKLSNEKGGKDVNGNGYVINSIEESPEDSAERLQDFYLSLEQDMRVGGTPFIPRWKDKDAESDAEDEKEREKREHDRMESETRVREVMEAVERTITSLFYDRLFMQPTTDDASHDEALSSRIAALNMLDLGLGHLGIEVGESVNESELNAVVNACGDMLTQLDNCRSPADKSAILVAAHKVVVDGLSRLPPIRLISENDVIVRDVEDTEDDPRTARPAFNSWGDTNTQAYPSEPNGVQPSEDIPESHQVSQPSVDSSSAEPGPTENKSVPSSSSKVKSHPPPLSLDQPTPSSSSEVPSPPPTHLELSPPQKDPTPVSGDVLLPLIIFSVVKANPPHLVSNLLFTQRFRNQSVGGEESYCLINLLAVAEFLENVDMAGLGLGDSDKVMSTADLTPIPLTRSPVTSETPLEPVDHGGLRGRVGQQVDAIADSANKVITGVVDSSFGILRSFMPNSATHPNSVVGLSAPGTPALSNMRPGFGLLRRESGFSIASLAASLPITGRSRSNTRGEESGQQLVTVSRPASVRSRASLKIRVGGDESQEESDDGDESSATNDEESEADGEDEDDADAVSGAGDARSIRSFESMLHSSKEKSRGARARKSLSDRLASVSALANLKGSEPASRRTSLLLPNQHPTIRPTDSPSSSRPASPVQLRLAPPKQRFMECTPDDLRLSEIGELLRDYRRLAEGIRAMGGFEE
ncbi:hypothetical protein BDZ97DRAFT_1820620 [Flammula alnicola]|nr:hypothetical protein BDZ97DRAFT_1820620 [Flammula alnicola]